MASRHLGQEYKVLVAPEGPVCTSIFFLLLLALMQHHFADTAAELAVGKKLEEIVMVVATLEQWADAYFVLRCIISCSANAVIKMLNCKTIPKC